MVDDCHTGEKDDTRMEDVSTGQRPHAQDDGGIMQSISSKLNYITLPVHYIT